MHAKGRYRPWLVLLVVLAAPGPTPAQIPTEGLVARWTLDDGSGTVAGDTSGGDHDATLVNGPVWTTGMMGGALSFDGIDDYVAVPISAAFDFGPGGFSIAAWIRTSVGTLEQYVIDFYCEGNFPHVEIYTGQFDSKVGTHVCRGELECERLTDGVVTTGHWRHVMITYDPTTTPGFLLYVDGARRESGTLELTVPVDGWDTISMAARVRLDGTVDEPWHGEIDDVLVYDRPLTPQQVADLYATYPVELQRFTVE